MTITRPFPVSKTLTAIAIGYRNDAAEMLHTKILPSVPVASERFGWLSFPLAQAFTVPELRVGRKSAPGQVEFSADENEGAVKHYGLDDVIPITDIEAAARSRREMGSRYDPESAATEGLTRLILLGRELRAATVVQNADNYDAPRRIALSGTDVLSDFVNSDPYEVLNDAMTKPLAYRANTVSMGMAVWEKIKRHPKLIKAVKGGLAEDGAITRQQLADLLETRPGPTAHRRFHVQHRQQGTTR